MIPKLYYHTVCPFSRLLRCVLLEQDINLELIQEPFWERRVGYLQLNPSGQLPTLIHQDSKNPISGIFAIIGFVDEVYFNGHLFGSTTETRASNRFLFDWFAKKLFDEVTKYIIKEKIIKTMLRSGAPNSQHIIAASKNMKYHMDYVEYLLTQSKYLTNDDHSCVVDLMTACQISIMDYIGDISWNHNKKAKHWYALMKSKPCFQHILKDIIPGIKQTSYYMDPDF